MISLANHSELLSGHLVFAALLSLTFALVTMAYLYTAERAAKRSTRARMVLLNTLYLVWQTNVAYMAVMALRTAHGIVQQEPLLLDAGWRMAPWMPVSAAILYLSVLGMSVAFWWQAEKR